jgi:two-component system sensor histidine kinase BaeS
LPAVFVEAVFTNRPAFWPTMPAMRLRIIHQLSLLLVATALLSVAAVGGFVAWNLKAGFSDYLRARDRQHVERFAAVVAARGARDPGFVDGMAQGIPMRELMDEFSDAEGITPPARRPRPPPPSGEGVPAYGPPGASGPRGDGPPRRGPPEGIARRIQIVDLQGRRLGGPGFPDDRNLLEAPVVVRGETVARVRMLPSTELEGVDLRFLNRQYIGLAAAAGVTLLVALLLALLAAPRLSRPLRELQAAARRIAGGELAVAVPEAGSREMAGLIGDVNRMAASLKTLEGARRSWIAQISHELRTPLSVLLGELESIEDGARQPTPEVLANLRGEVLQLVRLVNDLHTLSMADLGALPCEFSDGDAATALTRAAQRFGPRAQKAGLALDLRGGPAVQVRWDFGRVEQLLTNLLENSLRYTTAPGQVRVQWAATPRGVELRVDDTPPGVPPAQMAQLFEPLFRADTARQRRAAGPDGAATGGSGLGLAICRAIVQAHGGAIRAEASALGGLCLLASLPINADPHANAGGDTA